MPPSADFATGAFQGALLRIDLSRAQGLTVFSFAGMTKLGAAYRMCTGACGGIDALRNALGDLTCGGFRIFSLQAGAPWIMVMIAFLLLITYVPIISLWLPKLLMGAS